MLAAALLLLAGPGLAGEVNGPLPEGLSFDASRCRPEAAADEKLYSSDFRWGYSYPEMLAAFEMAYVSPKRLPDRAYWNAAARRFELPHLAGRGGPVVLPASFIRSIAAHIEDAFAADYVDAVFFPDMGHSHLLIPQELWERVYSRFPVERMSQMLSALFAEPRLEVLYHTAEQLKTLDEHRRPLPDPRILHRHRTRNIVGRNDGTRGLKVLQNHAEPANTVHEVPGYFWWSGGFSVSANAAGCFTYAAKGRTFRFDLSLFDLLPAPGSADLSASADGIAGAVGASGARASLSGARRAVP